MKISVIFPVYKPTLEQLVEAIESIRNQSYGNFECFFLYDSPIVEITDLLNHYKNIDNRFKIIYAEGKGLAHALNLGIDLSDGKYIARMDSDDISLPNRFKLQVELMEKSNLDIVGGDYLLIDNNGYIVDARLVPKNHMQIGIVMAKTVPFAHSSVMIRKKALESYDFKYNEDSMVVAEDYELWTRLYTHGFKFGNVSEWILKFRDSNTSLNKRVYAKCIKSARKISSEFVASNINNLILYVDHVNPQKLDRVNQESYAYLIYKLVLLNGFFSQLKNLKKITMRNKIIALLSFINGIV